MPRRLRYQVAASLDGFIADANGGYDWIFRDSAVDFKAYYAQFDIAVMGRKTYELVRTQGDGSIPGMRVVVFSRTLPPETRPGVTIAADDPVRTIAALKKEDGRDIWLFGGGVMFRSLLDAGMVDTVEVAVMPVLLGSGIPLLPPGAPAKLSLADRKILPTSGIVMLAYSVEGSTAPPPRITHVTTESKGR